MQRQPSASSKLFAKIATQTSHLAGRPVAFTLSTAIIVGWALSGPLFKFSDTWQLVINTGTTIITFLMVFIIQNSQNRDGAAIQAKLDELILVGKAANRFVGIEDLTDEEIEELRGKWRARAKRDVRRVDEVATVE
jgi:low affinity Fe/Cu permease